jgi:hypothetical protein
MFVYQTPSKAHAAFTLLISPITANIFSPLLKVIYFPTFKRSMQCTLL